MTAVAVGEIEETEKAGQLSQALARSLNRKANWTVDRIRSTLEYCDASKQFDPHEDSSPLRIVFDTRIRMDQSGSGEKRMMGLEPTTFCMASRRSSQLSYIRERRPV